MIMMYSNYPVEVAGTLVRRVFGWMALGLSLTGLTSVVINMIPNFQRAVVTNSAIMLILILAQFGLVIYLSFGIQKMSREAAIASFLGYSVLTGVTFSTLFLVYTGASLALTFLIYASMFAAMALYGLVTKSDLSGLGSFLSMGLIGLIVAMFINMFLGSAQFDFMISIIGVIIFTLFTAYDVQMVKRMGMSMLGTGADMTKVSIIGALKLYLDFINLFLFLLRFFGQRRD
jgi:FtsH-binding integral membrane protein